MKAEFRDATFANKVIPKRPPVLLDTQVVEVMEAIRKAGLNPKHFEWSDHSNQFEWSAHPESPIACLNHLGSDYYFIIAPFPKIVPKLELVFSPGGTYEINRSETVWIWEVALKLFGEWLVYLKDQIRAENLWRSWIDEVESVTASDFKQPKLLESLPDRKFTDEEQNTIRGLVEEFVETVKVDAEHRDGMTDAQVRLLNAQADVAIEQAKDMKVRRWFFVLATLYATWVHILDESPALKEWSTKVIGFIQETAQKLIS